MAERRSMMVLLLFAALAVLPGCGVIAHGISQKVTCTTTPPGALVRSTDGGECKTPCTVTLRRKNDATLTIERDGYEPVTLSLHSTMSTSSAGNILLPGGLVCWGIDLASGGGYRLVPERVDVQLKPVLPQ